MTIAQNKTKRQRGFSNFELLIVVVIIGILLAVIFMEFSGVQQKSRDSERKNDIDGLNVQVQIYQAEKGVYPTLAELNNPSFRKANLKTLDPANLQDPKGKNQILVAIPQPKAYAYQPAPAGCDNAAHGACTGYSLTAELEAGGTYSKSSL